MNCECIFNAFSDYLSLFFVGKNKKHETDLKQKKINGRRAIKHTKNPTLSLFPSFPLSPFLSTKAQSVLALDRVVGPDHPPPPALQRVALVKVERRDRGGLVDVNQEIKLFGDFRGKVVRVALGARDLIFCCFGLI